MNTNTDNHFALDSLADLDLHSVVADAVEYHGRQAVRLVEADEMGEAHALAILQNSNFTSGTIELDMAGAPRANAPEFARGVVGIAFWVQDTPSEDLRFACFFLRPTNARANDQLRRNHSIQYCVLPNYPWHRLRAEFPAVYESYTDLATGEWTRVRVTVANGSAQFYVNDAEQPCLIVNEILCDHPNGKVALWIGAGTEAYFSHLRIRE